MKIPIINSTDREATYTVKYKPCEGDNWELVDSGSLPPSGEHSYTAVKDGYYQVTLEVEEDNAGGDILSVTLPNNDGLQGK